MSEIISLLEARTDKIMKRESPILVVTIQVWKTDIREDGCFETRHLELLEFDSEKVDEKVATNIAVAHLDLVKRKWKGV